MVVRLTRKVAAASRASRGPAAAASRTARSGGGALDLKLGRYTARYPQIYVASKGPLLRGVSIISSLEGSSTFAGHQSTKVSKVVFEAEDEDLQSDEALWALYERWCKHFKMQRDHDEMAHRFNKFKHSVLLVQKVNKSDLPYKLEINKFTDGEFRGNVGSQDMLRRRMAVWQEAQKEMIWVKSLEEDWKREVESLSITTCPDASIKG